LNYTEPKKKYKYYQTHLNEVFSQEDESYAAFTLSGFDEQLSKF